MMQIAMVERFIGVGFSTPAGIKDVTIIPIPLQFAVFFCSFYIAVFNAIG